MSAGDVWKLPDGREALELDGSKGGLLRVAAIAPNWPFPCPPEIAVRRLCVAMPSRYLNGAVPQHKDEEARW
jgi:hypothetical protein